MQEHIARQVRLNWGDRPCPHPALDRRYFGSTQEGYVCIRCGAEFTKEEREQVIANRNLLKTTLSR
jgi:hypothetical protein